MTTRTPTGQFVAGQHSYREPQPHWKAAWLQHEYLSLQRSAADIAKGIGITEGAIFFWLRKHGIPRRTVAQARAVKHWGVSGAANPMHGKCGSLNPNWRGGVSPKFQQQAGAAA